MACRTIPGLMVFRPADANEASIAAELAFNYQDKASIILLTRQKLPVIDRNQYSHYDNFKKGGYIISDSNGNPDVTIIATGSEVSLALEAKKCLDNYNIRVVNLGCWELFDEQSSDYKNTVIDEHSFKISIEAGVTMGWQKYTGNKGLNIGIDRYGESAPGTDVADYLGISLDKVLSKIKECLHDI